MLAAEEGTFHEMRFRYEPEWWPEPDGASWGQAYVPVADRARFEHHAGLDDCWVSLVPRRERSGLYLGLSTVMWARLDTGKQADELARFRPAPTVVLREGSSVRRVALWWVSAALNVVQLERGNKRIAHALGAKKKHATPDELFHPPGVVLRFGRERRPLVVHVEHWSGERFTPGQVAGALRDAPEPWRPEGVAA